MIHSVRFGSKARGKKGGNASTLVLFCMLLGYAIKTVKTTQELSIYSCATFITLVAANWDLKCPRNE